MGNAEEMFAGDSVEKRGRWAFEQRKENAL